MGLIVGFVRCRSHPSFSSGHINEDLNEAFVEDVDLEEADLFDKINELDHMISLVRKARSVEDDDNDIVGEKEMLLVLDQIDLTWADNVEAVADVMKTLSGERHVEFLMNKFMMTNKDVKDDIVSDPHKLVRRSPYPHESSQAHTHDKPKLENISRQRRSASVPVETHKTQVMKEEVFNKMVDIMDKKLKKKRSIDESSFSSFDSLPRKQPIIHFEN